MSLRVDPTFRNQTTPAASPSFAGPSVSIVDADGRSPRQRRRVDQFDQYQPSSTIHSPASPQYGYGVHPVRFRPILTLLQNSRLRSFITFHWPAWVSK